MASGTEPGGERFVTVPPQEPELLTNRGENIQVQAVPISNFS